MKTDVARYEEECMTCRKVTAEHQKPHAKLQPLEIPEWKWEHLTMDFITKLPRTTRGVDTIRVIVDRLTKSSHFLAIKESSSAEKLAEVFVQEIVSLHGVSVSIISDRDTRFIGPCEVITRVGKVAYRLELPDELSLIHNTFHVSQLRQ